GTSHVSICRRLFAFSGPAYLVSVGYMDPGNWATDLEGGARFGYQLLWVLVMSNAMAILLQTLSARLGIIRGLDLAQACRERYPRPVSLALWVLCEIAIGACDLAEVLGAAIGLNLLFGLPLLAGVLLTAADTLLLLWFQRFGIRAMEAFVLALIAIIGGCFFIEILLSKPVFSEVITGLIPRLSGMEGLYAAIAVFALALICSGQSSTLTGTLAGQIVMEGFLNFRMRPWLRRLLTRMMAITPAAVTVYLSGAAGTFKLLILSQVILSMQLPFAVIPLIHFTSDRRRMGEFANKLWVLVLAWISAAVIVVLNIWVVVQILTGWLEAAGRFRGLVLTLLVPLS